MDKRTGDQPNADTQACAGSEPDRIAAPAGEAAPTPDTIAKLDRSAPPLPTEPAASAVETPSSTAEIVEPPKSRPARELATIIRLDDVRPEAPEAATTGASAGSTWARARRLTPLAATIAIAAAVGAMAGSLATTGLGALWSDGAVPTASADAGPLQNSIAHINAELTALKASLDTSGKSANAQLAKLGDRFDRLERAQAEPAAKLAKLSDAVDRIERSASAADHETTGSIAPATPQPPQTAPAVQPVRPAGPPVLDGWIVRSVYNGAALIQARYGGVIEVEPGDNLPGLGRIQTIKRQDGRWVVVTSRGLIVAR